MTETSTDVKSIFADALEKATREERAAYLDTACRGDGNLRLKVELLLEAHAAAVDIPDSLIVNLDIIPDGEELNEGSGTVDGRYELLEKIGEGGMAVVYTAEQTQPIRRKVALKIIKAGMDTKQVIARFEAERQALAMMDHPNIAKVFDAGATETGRPYFAMELVTGVSITEYCDANHLSTKDRLALFVQVCHAIQHAHQKGIIHRDIKPSNVLVTMHDGKPVPKVIDFGIAKATNQRLTEQTLFTRYAQIIGTPAYMSPEQADLSDVDIDTRSDIYSLGVLLYELLTGMTPFSERQLREAGYVEMQRVIREEEPLRPSTRITTLGEAAQEVATRRRTSVTELTKRLRSELEWIPLMAMRKDRTQRYPSASELAQDVENYLSDRPLVAGPESVMYRFRKTVSKHRVSIIAGFIVAVALLVGLIVSTSLYVNLRRAQTFAAKLATQVEVHDKLSTVQRLYGQGRYQEALDAINATLHEHDLRSQAHLLRAQLLIELGRTREAVENLDELTRAEPEIAGAAHYLLARANVAIDPDKADQHRKLAESILPQTTEAYYWRAMIAASADEAISWLSKTLELDPQHYAAHKARALANSSVKAYQVMLEDAGAMVVLRPRDYLGYSLRAIARREAGQLEEAVRDSARAIARCSIEEELPRLYEQRIETYMQMREYTKVLADAQELIALSPDSLDGPFRAFIVHMAQGDYGKARAVYKDFVRRITGADKRPIWFLEGRLERYVFDLLETGQPFALPPDIAEQSPFYLMQQSADLYALLRRNARPLTVCDGFWPAGGWSPDGRCLVYQRHSSFSWLPGAIEGHDPAMDQPRIEIMDLETGRTRQTGGSGYNPAWSPDGKFIAFTKYYGDDAARGVWLIPTGAGQPRRLAAGAGAQWARDSEHIYFGRGRTLLSIAIDVPNAEPVPVPEISPGPISPNEDLIATCESAKDSISAVCVLTFPQGQEVARWRLPWPLRRFGTQLQWHPNGKTLILNSRYFDSQTGMCLFDVESGEAMHISRLRRPWCQTMWSPGGARLLISPFGTAAGTSPWMMEIDTERPLEEVLAPALSTEEFLSMLRHKWDQRIAADSVYAKHYVSRAIVLLAAGDYEGAEQDLTECTRLLVDPNDPAVYALRYWGEMYAGTNRHREVETFARANLALADRYPDQYPAVTDANHPCQLLMQAYRLQDMTDKMADLRRERPDWFPAPSGGLHGSPGVDVSQSHDP